MRKPKGPHRRKTICEVTPQGWPSVVTVKLTFLYGAGERPTIEVRVAGSHCPRRVLVDDLIEHVLERRPLPVTPAESERRKLAERVERAAAVMGPELPFGGNSPIPFGGVVTLQDGGQAA